MLTVDLIMNPNIPDAIVVMTTVENEEQAVRIARQLASSPARQLFGSHLAACVQVLPRMTSIYRWEENVEVASEQLLIIKTTHFNYPELEIAIRNAHPYQVPEIIAIPVVAGSTDYLRWLDDSVRGQTT